MIICNSPVADATPFNFATSFPALKGRAKVTAPLMRRICAAALISLSLNQSLRLRQFAPAPLLHAAPRLGIVTEEHAQKRIVAEFAVQHTGQTNLLLDHRHGGDVINAAAQSPRAIDAGAMIDDRIERQDRRGRRVDLCAM